MPKLRNMRWEEFARQTAIGKSRSEAVVLAGFGVGDKAKDSKRGTNLASKQEIQARITELQLDLQASSIKRAELDREYVLTNLKDVYEACRADKPVFDKRGEPTGLYTFNAAGANRALELIGKEIGMFADKLILGNLDSELDGLSGEDLRTFVRGAASEVGLRVVDMNDDELRTFILKQAPRIGLRVTEDREDPEGAGPQETEGLRAVS